MSDSEPNATNPDPTAAAEVRETDDTDSLSMFPSEGSKSEEPSDPITGIRKARYRSGHSVPVAIADDRAAREAIRKMGAYVETVATLQAICTSIDTRLVQAEETLARTEGLVADRSLHDLSTGIAARLTATEDTVRHIERVVTSGPPEELFALQTLCANIEKRLAQVEGALGRLSGTEDAVRRIEGLVASGALAELSARVDSAFAQSDDALRRIEAALESKSEAALIHCGAVAREAAVAVVPSRSSPAPALSSPSPTVSSLPATERIVGLGAATVVLVGVLIFVAPARVPISVAAPPSPATEQQPAPPIVEQEPQEQAPPEEPAPPTRLSPPPDLTPPRRRRGVAHLFGQRWTRPLLPSPPYDSSEISRLPRRHPARRCLSTGVQWA